MVCKRCKGEIERYPLADWIVTNSIAHTPVPEAWKGAAGMNCPEGVGTWHEPEPLPMDFVIDDLKIIQADLR